MPQERQAIFRDNAILVLATLAWALAIAAAWLHLTQGPQTQRINVRWAPTVSDAVRANLEREWGLDDGLPNEQRTWSYRLRDRSTANVARLVGDARVEDTFHLDRAAHRVQLDRPDLDPALRSVLEAEWLPAIALILALIAAAATYVSRRALRRVVDATATATNRAALPVVLITGAAFEYDPAEEPTPRRWELIAGACLGLLLLVPLLLYGPYEEEIVQATILPNQVFYRALFRGEWLFWLNDLGFGSPMPLGDPLLFHPVFAPLAAFASLRVTFSGVWIAHVIVMAVYFLRLAAVSGARVPGIRLLLLLCYLTSLPFAFYFYATDWIQMAITWSLYPVLVFYLRAAMLGGARDEFWLTTLRLALLFGFWVINAHPGYIVPMTAALIVYAVAVAPLDPRSWRCFLTGGMLCAGIAAARIYMLLHEAQLFPPGVESLRAGTTIDAYLGAVAAPFIPLADRGPFIGVGLAASVLVALLRPATLRDPHLRGCALACVAAALLNVTPPDVSNRVVPAIGNWLFRDPMLFFALLVGGHVLQQSVRDARPWLPRAAVVVALLQVIQQGIVIILPNYHSMLEHRGRLLFYRYQGQAVGLGRAILDTAQTSGRRVYLSPLVEGAMRGSLSTDGVHFSSDLVLLGLNPVNAWFKNVSMVALYPTQTLMESGIAGDLNVIHNKALLDVLAINMVLSTERETGVPEGLIVGDRPAVREPRMHDLLVLANPDAWPQAVLLEPDAYRIELPIFDGCGHQAALCRDYAALKRTRLDGPVQLTVANGRYVARVPPADRERLLFISATYRPEWEASSGGRVLAVHPVAGGFLGVTVPPGVTDVIAAYVPRVHRALTWFSGVLFFCVAALVMSGLRRRVDRAPAHTRGIGSTT